MSKIIDGINTEIITDLDYVSTPIPESGIFKISPSGFSKFVERPHTWYREEILGEDKFNYNTSSILGTIVHYCAERVAKNLEVDIAQIDAYIDKHAENDDYNPGIVQNEYTAMAERLVNDYVLERCGEFLEVETQHCAEIKNGFYAAGTLDILEGIMQACMVSDYKSYNSKTKPRAIPMHYKYQLLVYAWILWKNGYNPDRIRLVYINRNIDGDISEKTGKRLKSYPPEITVLTETIETTDLEFIGGLLELCVDSCEASQEYPELRHVIWHDPRLAV